MRTLTGAFEKIETPRSPGSREGPAPELHQQRIVEPKRWRMATI